METTPHLWEIHHPYYCSESNYYKNGVGEHFDSWADFHGAMGSADDDLNLLFRWDWKRPDPDDYEPDEMPDHDTLWVFYMQQRKGKFVPSSVSVTEADEPAVRAWLAARWEHMRGLWSGVSS